MQTLTTLGLALAAWAGSTTAAHLLHAPGTPAAVAAQDPDWTWKGTVAAGKTIEIKGVNGDVRATATSGSEVVVTAVKQARKSDPADVTIEVVNGAAGVTICAVYPSDGKQRNSCAAGDGGHMSTHNNDVSVHFTVQVPAGVKFAGNTVNGSVTTERLGGDVDVATVNGSVRVVAAGVVHASTVNGSVDVSMGRADWSGKVELSTVNGNIRATLPATFSAVVNGSTVNGSIESEFPLTVQGKFGPRSVHGTIGTGGRTLDLETVNGSITIAKGN
ncbi:MAG TPA: DUF4097 family beta strand repeat-containing protein [Gemmatimonadales bacterium]|nr:DUF4097 family beta strand repeat-containing protein [Gemmatimonadales bacterium]